MVRQCQCNVKAMVRQCQGNVKVMSRKGQGKLMARSRRGQGKGERQGQGKIYVRLKQSCHNHGHNYNLMGFDTIEIDLLFDFLVDYIICNCIFD